MKILIERRQYRADEYEVIALIEIVGYELGDSHRVEFHVNTRHVVEWWEPHDVEAIARFKERWSL